MGKRIIMQRRGRATSTYRVSKKAFNHKLQFPTNLTGEGTVVKILNSRAHTCPLAKINSEKGAFYIPAFNLMVEGQKIYFENGKIDKGNILKLKDIPVKTKIYCIESHPNDGGKYIKAGGNYAIINRIIGDFVYVLMPSKKEKKFNKNCKAIIGVVAGEGRVDKPIVKAGKQYHIKKTKSKLWPRTSATKMNAIDHPFGSGRGKNPKPRIAKRNAPAGARVGLIRPRRTGKRK
jgi:large subunit ribosomal protein L2